MRYLLYSALLLASSSAFGETFDPALMQKIAGQLERQRNEVQTAQAICSANLMTLQEEIEKLKRQLEAKEPKDAK